MEFVLWINNDALFDTLPFMAEAVSALHSLAIVVSASLWNMVCGWPFISPWAGAASGTNRRRKPATHPHGNILKWPLFVRLFLNKLKRNENYHFIASMAPRYPGMMATFSFFCIAVIILSATSSELNVGTHLF